MSSLVVPCLVGWLTWIVIISLLLQSGSSDRNRCFFRGGRGEGQGRGVAEADGRGLGWQGRGVTEARVGAGEVQGVEHR